MKISIAQFCTLLLLTLELYSLNGYAAKRGSRSECILGEIQNAGRASLPKRLKNILSLLDDHSAFNLTAWAKDLVEARTEIEAMRPEQHAELRREIARRYSTASSSSKNGVGTKRILDILIGYEFPLQTRMQKAAQDAKKLKQDPAHAVRLTYEAHLNEIQKTLNSQQAPLQLASALQEVLRDPKNHQLFPPGTSFRIFGSQVNGTARSGSDLDLFISNEVLDRNSLYALRDRLNQELQSRLGTSAPPIKDLFPIDVADGVRMLLLKPAIQIEIKGNKAQLILQSSALRVQRSQNPSDLLERSGPSSTYDIELPLSSQ